MLSPLRKKKQNTKPNCGSRFDATNADCWLADESRTGATETSGERKSKTCRDPKETHECWGGGGVGALEAQSTFVFLLNVTLTSLNAHIVCVCVVLISAHEESIKVAALQTSFSVSGYWLLIRCYASTRIWQITFHLHLLSFQCVERESEAEAQRVQSKPFFFLVLFPLSFWHFLGKQNVKVFGTPTTQCAQLSIY